MTVPLIETQSLCFKYSGSDGYILENVDFAIFDGEKLSLHGPNGGGKTTFLHLIMGLLKPTEGKILFHGTEVRGSMELQTLRRKVGFVFQDPDDQLFCPTLLEDVAFGPLNLGMTRNEARAHSLDILKRVGLERYADKPAFNLSGGEKQLAALATALSMDPELLILDEPTNALDSNSKHILTEILLNFEKSLIVVSHEESFTREVAPHGYLLDNGTMTPLD